MQLLLNSFIKSHFVSLPAAPIEQAFPSSVKWYEGNSPHSVGEWEILLRFFWMGGGKLKSDFDHVNLFQS